MTTDFRALCVELTDCLEKADWPHRYKVVFQQWMDIAHAALAEPEAEGPTDEELRDLWSWAAGQDQGPWPTQYHCFARAVLARWAHPAAAPVPDFGEVAAALKVIDKMQQEWVLLGNDDDGTASPSLSMPISLRRFTVLRDALFRAATLLQQQTAPVRVSERLPGPEDCDAEGRCWLYGKVKGDWRLIDPNNSGVPQLKYCFSHWLPANALPLPAPEGGESQP